MSVGSGGALLGDLVAESLQLADVFRLRRSGSVATVVEVVKAGGGVSEQALNDDKSGAAGDLPSRGSLTRVQQAREGEHAPA
jgi:hypothetical protein